MVEEQTQQKSKKPKKGKSRVVLFVFLFLSLIGLFMIAKYLIPRAMVYLTRAAKPTEVSLSNSYVFGAPLRALPDGKTKVRINVFLLNDEGKGVPDKIVELASRPKGSVVNGNVQIKNVQPATDEFGKTVFEVTSNYEGQFVVSALVGGVEIPQTVTLTFR